MADTTTNSAPAATKKKKAKRIVPAGQLHVKATFNNTIITITDKKGEVIATASAGACGFRGSKKGTAYAAQIASEKALGNAKQNNSLHSIEVFVNGIGQGRDAAVRAAMTVGIDVESITDKTGVAHGGCRPRKVRHP